jgi:hypothetical protein
MHAARVELHDAVGIRQSAVAHAGIRGIEFDDVDAGDTASSTSKLGTSLVATLPLVICSKASCTHVFVPPFL